MRIAAFFAIVLLFAAGVLTTRTSMPAGAAEGDDPGKETCSTVFVSGKGVIDSCSGARKPTSRVYPRKPGVPPEGCVDECPASAETSATPKPSGTPGPSSSGTPAAATPDATPINTQNTPAMATTPTAPQNCDRVSYPDVCIPSAPPYLSCSDIPDRNFRVRAPDPHRFDADGNGIGCEEVRGPTIGR
jgi:hypothetical protein